MLHDFTLSKLLLGFLLIAVIGLTVVQYKQRTVPIPRLAYVNTEKLLDSYQAMLDARRQYQRQKQEWEQNLGTLEREARQAATAQQVPNHVGSQTQATGLATARLKQQQFDNYRQAVLQQGPLEMERLTKPVLEHINQFLARYGQTHNYDFVLATSEAGSIVYANPALDVTTPVVAALNQALRDSLKVK